MEESLIKTIYRVVVRVSEDKEKMKPHAVSKYVGAVTNSKASEQEEPGFRG